MRIAATSSMEIGNCPLVVAGKPLPLVVGLDRVTAEDVHQVGGKAANLGRMLAAGLPVPPGFCITTEAFRQFVFACPDIDPLWTALGTIGPQHIDEARAVGLRVRECLAAAALPPVVEQAVVAAWQSQGTMRAYAVRFSATAEDQPDASFAGQGETFLNVCGREAVLQSVRACWLSLFDDRAILYRMHQRIDHRTLAMAVVVQELISPDVSGVFFTADPVSGGTQRMVIEAVYGLGLSLVSGEVSPDHFVLLGRSCGCSSDAWGGSRSRSCRTGATAYISGTLARGGQERRAWTRLPPGVWGSWLSRPERALGGPQDMEWAIRGERIFLVQSRPITTLARKADPPQTIWSNMNSWEVLPDVLTPMTWSVANFQLHCLFDPLVGLLGIDVERQPIFGLVAGRAYANLNTLAKILRAAPGLDRLDFVAGLGGQHGDLLVGLVRRESVGDWRQRLRRVARYVRFVAWCAGHGADQRAARVLADFRRRVDELAPCDLAMKSETRLLDHLGLLLHPLKRFGSDAAACVAVAMIFVHLFFNFVKSRLGQADGAIANRMLGGLNGLASAEAGLELWRLAAWAGRRPALQAILWGSDGLRVVAAAAGCDCRPRPCAFGARARVPQTLGPVHALPRSPRLWRDGRPQSPLVRVAHQSSRPVARLPRRSGRYGSAGIPAASGETA